MGIIEVESMIHCIIHVLKKDKTYNLKLIWLFVPDPRDNYHLVVDCSKDLMRDHCYWPIVSDMINILSHRPIAYKFMSDDRLLQFWFEIISCLQGMN